MEQIIKPCVLLQSPPSKTIPPPLNKNGLTYVRPVFILYGEDEIQLFSGSRGRAEAGVLFEKYSIKILINFILIYSSSKFFQDFYYFITFKRSRKEKNMNVVEPIRKKKDLEKIESILKEQSLRDLLIFTVGINCGLRISDILNLNVGDVSNKDYISIVEKKTGKYKRFPINSKLKPMFEKFTQGRNPEEPLFLSIFHNRMERTQCYRIVKNACQKAGINYKTGTHTLRKTFGYHHYQKFKDVAVLQKIFNHYSPYVTLQYIGINQDIIDASYNNFVL